jgi:membrane protease YdiL (CAAX protease family)
MNTRNPDQFFRLAYVVFRFFLLAMFTTIPFGGLVWWKTGSFKSALPIVAVILVIALAVSFWDYKALGKKMRGIEAKKNATE